MKKFVSSHSQRLWRGCALALALFIVSAFAPANAQTTAPAAVSGAEAASPKAPTTQTATAGMIEKVTPSNPASVQLSFAPLVKKVAPAVVNIY
ncbi:MAG TPA: hypothetical protein VGD95_01725, partial [Micavibrio sp.]